MTRRTSRSINACCVSMVPRRRRESASEGEPGWKDVEPGCATGGGGGQRVRAHVLDSESGGAKGHYPNPKTTQPPRGSAPGELFFGAGFGKRAPTGRWVREWRRTWPSRRRRRRPRTARARGRTMWSIWTPRTPPARTPAISIGRARKVSAGPNTVATSGIGAIAAGPSLTVALAEPAAEAPLSAARPVSLIGRRDPLRRSSPSSGRFRDRAPARIEAGARGR
jgi:hypothetical protein